MTDVRPPRGGQTRRSGDRRRHRHLTERTTMTRLHRTPRRALALAAVLAGFAPAAVALAEPDTNIQKPGHVALADPDTNIQKPGHVAISRPLGDA
jgi:hypothetical protein